MTLSLKRQKSCEFKYRLSISYDGSPFKGWQVQTKAPSVQGVLERTFQDLTKEKVTLFGAGRTDAGVHALCQTAHFSLKTPLMPHFLERANHLLPPEVRLLSIEKADSDFHARFSAVQKIYHYRITTNPILDPFENRYRTFFPGDMNFEKLQQAFKFFIGTHDFSSFANSLKPHRSPMKTIHSILHIPEGKDRFRLEFIGDGFLYKMVRNLVGTLIYIARGRIRLEEIPSMLRAKKRGVAPPPAPPQGLFLVAVLY